MNAITNAPYWRNDGITRRHVEEHREMLSDVCRMTPGQLCETITYCRDIYNPYSDELTRRAGTYNAFHRLGATDRERGQVLRRAAKAFGIRLY